MRFTDLGFNAILLPITAALYHCIPNKLKAAALFLISILFFALAEPQFVWIFAALIPDFIFSSRVDRIPADRKSLYCRLLVIKDFVIMLIFGVMLPMAERRAAPFGVMLLCLTSIDHIVSRNREGFRPCTFFQSAAAVTFMARMQHGPAGSVNSLVSQLQRPSASVSSMSRGIMYVISGIAKRVILSEQLFALFKTISHISPAEYSTALSWLCALCGGMGVYFTLSAYSDIARGIACMFSLSLPRTVYFPFQAKNLRDHIYRLNMPLEDLLSRLLIPGRKREQAAQINYLISFMMPVIIALFFSPSGGFLLWAIYMSALVILDWLVMRHIPAPITLLARIITFLITLPSYILLLPAPLAHRLMMMVSLIPVSGDTLINNSAIYLISSNSFLLVIGIFFCTSILDSLSHITQKQFPQFWWAISTAMHTVLLILTLSFLMWNVR